MPRRVLFIEELPSALHQECSAALDCVAEYAPWGSLSRERLRERRLDLVIVVALSRSPPVGDLFRWLTKNPIAAATFAVLAADDDLIRAAVEAVDDFIVAPLRPSELQNRVTRLLGSERDECAKAAAHERLTREMALAGLVGKHPAFLRTVSQIPVVAEINSPVCPTVSKTRIHYSIATIARDANPHEHRPPSADRVRAATAFLLMAQYNGQDRRRTSGLFSLT